MPYRCEYNESDTCTNCAHEPGSLTCTICTYVTEDKCPIANGEKYPSHRKVCKKCLFEQRKGDGKRMIMDEKEMDEQIEKYMELKPCKCGEIPYVACVGTDLYEVACKCGRTTPICGSRKKAIEEWNANVADLRSSKKEESLEPCVCGVMPHLEAIKYRGSTHYRYECPNCGTTTIDYATGAEAKDAWNRWAGKPTDVTDCVIKDSGERREFETGAVEIEIDLTKVRNAKKIRIVVAD